MKRHFIFQLVIGCWLAAGLSWAQETIIETTSESATGALAPEQDEKLSPEKIQQLDQIIAEQHAMRDAAFERFVTLDSIHEAYQFADVDMLIDCALQLGHGERILLRQHRSGITPNDLLRFATKAAATMKNAAIFERLQQAVNTFELSELGAVIRIAKKTASQPRDTSKNLGKYEVLREMIEHAGLTGDLTQLDELLEGLPEDLSVQQRMVATDMIDEWKSSLADGQADSPLHKLAAPSRFWSHAFTSSSPPDIFPGYSSFGPNQRIYFQASFAAGSPGPYYLRVDLLRGSENIAMQLGSFPWIKTVSSMANHWIHTKPVLSGSRGFAHIKLRAKFVCGSGYFRTTSYRYVKLLSPAD